MARGASLGHEMSLRAQLGQGSAFCALTRMDATLC